MHCCRALTLALARLSCFITVNKHSIFEGDTVLCVCDDFGIGLVECLVLFTSARVQEHRHRSSVNLGARHFCWKIYIWKNNKAVEFYVIIAPKIFSPNLWGQMSSCSPSPSPMPMSMRYCDHSSFFVRYAGCDFLENYTSDFSKIWHTC